MEVKEIRTALIMATRIKFTRDNKNLLFMDNIALYGDFIESELVEKQIQLSETNDKLKEMETQKQILQGFVLEYTNFINDNQLNNLIHQWRLKH